MRLPWILVLVAWTAAATQGDIIRSHFAPAAGTAERPAASVAWIADGTLAFAHFGQVALPGGPPPGNDTVYEIGSITKAFTGVLLADMVLNGDVTLETTLGELLPGRSEAGPGALREDPPGYPEPVQKITLAQLATHASGLPRLPGNLFLTVKDQANPYANYTLDHLEAFLREYKGAPADPKPEYSNLGFGLLGHALATKAGKPYEALITERVLAPLGMTDTAIGLDGSQRQRLAPGHANGKPTSNWDVPALAGAGALRSTPADMAKMLAALLDPPDTRIGRAIRMARDPRADYAAGARIGLGWITVKAENGRGLTWHNGGTGGYRSFIGVIPDAKAGLVVLTNAAANPDAIAMKALNALAR